MTALMETLMEMSWKLTVVGPLALEILGGKSNSIYRFRCVEEDYLFGKPVFYESVEMSKKDELECLLEATTIAALAGAVESDGLKAKYMGVFMGVFKDR